jgi:hypothetical protein
MNLAGGILERSCRGYFGPNISAMYCVDSFHYLFGCLALLNSGWTGCALRWWLCSSLIIQELNSNLATPNRSTFPQHSHNRAFKTWLHQLLSAAFFACPTFGKRERTMADVLAGSFPYSPLEGDTRQIRLLVLHPGASESQIEFHLETASFETGTPRSQLSSIVLRVAELIAHLDDLHQCPPNRGS